MSATRTHTWRLASTSAGDISAYELFPLCRTGGGYEEVWEKLASKCRKFPGKLAAVQLRSRDGSIVCLMRGTEVRTPQEDGVQRGDVFVHRDEGRKKRIRAVCRGDALVLQERREAPLSQTEQRAERGLKRTPLKHFHEASTLKLRQTSRSQQALASQVLQYLCFHFLARNKARDQVFEEGSSHPGL